MAQLQQEPEREVVIYKNEGEPLGISIKGVWVLGSSLLFLFWARPWLP